MTNKVFIVRRQVFEGRRRRGVPAHLNIFSVKSIAEDISKVTFHSLLLFFSVRRQDFQRKKIVGAYLLGASREERNSFVYQSDVKVFKGRRPLGHTCSGHGNQGKVKEKS